MGKSDVGTEGSSPERGKSGSTSSEGGKSHDMTKQLFTEHSGKQQVEQDLQAARLALIGVGTDMAEKAGIDSVEGIAFDENYEPLTREIAEHQEIYQEYIGSIQGEIKKHFQDYYDKIKDIIDRNQKWNYEVFEIAANDLGVLADTTQAYVLENKCNESLKDLEQRNHEIYTFYREEYKSCTANINAAGERYKETRQAEDARGHRSAVLGLSWLSEGLERSLESYRELTTTDQEDGGVLIEPVGDDMS